MQHMDGYGGQEPRSAFWAAYRAQQNVFAKSKRNGHARTHQPRPASDGRQGLSDGGWVMLFNAGQHNEGVYTQTQHETHVNSILAFEGPDDAHFFSKELIAKGFDLPTPVYWSEAGLASFCRTSGFQVSRVPRGTVPAPPDNAFERGDTDERSDSERPYAARQDPYGSHRLWLEELLKQPGCDDDDCIVR
jgi:hypothetical protein